MTQHDLVDAVMAIALHPDEELSDIQDIVLAVSVDGGLKVVANGADVHELKAQLGEDAQLSEDAKEFDLIAEALHEAKLGKPFDLIREVVGYIASTGASVVRVSMAPLNGQPARTMAFDVETRGGKLITSTTYESEAFGAAIGVELPAVADKQITQPSAEEAQATAQVKGPTSGPRSKP